MPAATDVEEALTSLRTMLSADGYDLELRTNRSDLLVAEIKAGPDACAECLVPKDMMRVYFDSALRKSLGPDIPDIELVYPGDTET